MKRVEGREETAAFPESEREAAGKPPSNRGVSRK